jgi:hypothetical protein
MIGLLLALVILGVVWYLIDSIPMKPQVKTVITVVMIVILIGIVLQFLGVGLGGFRVWQR